LIRGTEKFEVIRREKRSKKVLFTLPSGLLEGRLERCMYEGMRLSAGRGMAGWGERGWGDLSGEEG
jgi:hypothetical protein